MKILLSETFIISMIGTVLLAITSSLVGSLNVFKRQSLIGDAIGHSTFPGIIIAFMIFQSRNTILLLLGASVSASISYFLIHLSSKKSNIALDANLAIFLSGFFGLGLVLKSIIQGNSNFANASQAGLDSYIFGQSAYILKSDIYLILGVFVVILLSMVIFYKELKVYLFDREFASLIGISTHKIDMLVLIMTILVISIGIKSVGSVLISSLLILPIVTANQWTSKFSMILLISCLSSAISAFFGNYISTMYMGLSTGPTIILISGIIALVSMILGRKGAVRKILRRGK